MIDSKTFSAEHIRNIQSQTKRDPALIERSIFALGLLEAVARADLPFIFKGGSSLMLLMEKPRRFSTDIDIVVAPGVDIDGFLAVAATIWPFVRITEHMRKAVANIEKRHFKFAFTSPLSGRELTILLDVLFEENPYSTTFKKSISNELLLVNHPDVYVYLPNANCILADKLTAFAPYTTGIPYNIDKELEIIKQLYDIAALADHIDDFSEVKSNYTNVRLRPTTHRVCALSGRNESALRTAPSRRFAAHRAYARCLVRLTTCFLFVLCWCKRTNISRNEIKYRELVIMPEDALLDTLRAATCIAGRGVYHPDEYLMLKRGVHNIRNHIYSENFNGEVVVQRACIVMYLAVAILTNQDNLPCFMENDFYESTDIQLGEYGKLSYIRKIDKLAYKYLVETIKMLP